MLRPVRCLVTILFASRVQLAAENLALRHQLGVLGRTVKRPRLRRRDRIFWVWLYKLWPGWRSALVVVKPATVVAWHREGFKLYWRWNSRKHGRPKVDLEIRSLIRRLSLDNPLWGTPRVQSELRLLGYDVAESTVARYMVRRRPGPPSQTWRSFLENHMGCTAACDFFVVHTITFRLLYCFVILGHGRRQILHFNVTAHPTAGWTSQQIVEAFPADGTEPKYLLRDRDSIYGDYFQHRVKNMGIEEVVIAWRSPWQNPYCERVIGTLRRECLDHVIILNEAHLRRMLSSFLDYYHASRPHQSFGRNAPTPRDIEPRSRGRVIGIPQVGGLHNRYSRAA
jgi:putative transposase